MKTAEGSSFLGWKVHHVKGKHRGCEHNRSLSGGSPNPLSNF